MKKRGISRSPLSIEPLLQKVLQNLESVEIFKCAIINKLAYKLSKAAETHYDDFTLSIDPLGGALLINNPNNLKGKLLTLTSEIFKRTQNFLCCIEICDGMSHEISQCYKEADFKSLECFVLKIEHDNIVSNIDFETILERVKNCECFVLDNQTSSVFEINSNVICKATDFNVNGPFDLSHISQSNFPDLDTLDIRLKRDENDGFFRINLNKLNEFSGIKNIIIDDWLPTSSYFVEFPATIQNVECLQIFTLRNESVDIEENKELLYSEITNIALKMPELKLIVSTTPLDGLIISSSVEIFTDEDTERTDRRVAEVTGIGMDLFEEI